MSDGRIMTEKEKQNVATVVEEGKRDGAVGRKSSSAPRQPSCDSSSCTCISSTTLALILVSMRVGQTERRRDNVSVDVFRGRHKNCG